MNATNPLSWSLKYKAELICKMEGYTEAMIKQILVWNFDLQDQIFESIDYDNDDNCRDSFIAVNDLTKHRAQLCEALKQIETIKRECYEEALKEIETIKGESYESA
jgi:hypothetical protein|tara:strand:+ start:311 stop:628 length:318 start_codon:yes stop_codon:yes gene_type:complete